MERTVVLASGSPRRSELLARMGISFIIDAADIDERCDGDAPQMVRTVARRKAEAVAPRHPDAIILAADTVVVADSILGKPRDEADAARMLRALSGRWHEVYTGVCTIYRGETRVDAAMTRVHFVTLTEEDIHSYIQSGEPMGKAGAYGIQGMAGMYIDRVEGCPHNVIGLPLVLTRTLLTF